jgi:hypothetical protein
MTDTGNRGQSRRMSLVEAIANVAVGYAIAVLTQILVFPLFGLQVSLADNLAIGLAFTAISLTRSYVLRRLFEAFRSREAETMTAGQIARRHPSL